MVDKQDVQDSVERRSVLIPFPGDANILSGSSEHNVDGSRALGLRLDANVTLMVDGDVVQRLVVTCVCNDGEKDVDQPVAVLHDVGALDRFVDLVREAAVHGRGGRMTVDCHEYVGAVDALNWITDGISDDLVKDAVLELTCPIADQVAIVTWPESDPRHDFCSLHARMDATTMSALVEAHTFVSRFVEGTLARIEEHKAAVASMAGM